MNWLVLSLVPIMAVPKDIEARFRSISGNDQVETWKKDLIRNALEGKMGESGKARLLFYHPREAGRNWKDWDDTKIETKVRPGVASCTVNYWHRWGKHAIWFEGVGIQIVEDNFPEFNGKYVFDIAVPERYMGQSYSDWIWDDSRVSFARDTCISGRFIELKGDIPIGN